jgi:hypothetical protein
LIDDFYIPRKEANVIMPGTVNTRIQPSRNGCPRQILEPKDIALLASPTACLNDVCINGCAVLLFSEMRSLFTGRGAMLSSHDLPRIRYNASDDILWRNVSWTSYWEKDVWILPIHRPSNIGHWVLCVIRFSSKELQLFDSFAERKPWKRDIKVSLNLFRWNMRLMKSKDIMKLIARFLTIARQRHHHVPIDVDGWTARPLKVSSAFKLKYPSDKLVDLFQGHTCPKQ